MPLPTFYIPYLILIINCILFDFIRKLINKIDTNEFRLFFSEIISTLELCADCSELGVVWEKHGTFGYGISLLLLCSWWFSKFDEAEACPCGPIESIIFFKEIQNPNIYIKLCGQFMGAYLTAKYTQCIWCFHLAPEHIILHTKRCQASLQVNVFYGFMVELIITYISRFIALESDSLPENLSIIINSFTTVFLCIMALDTSGGFFNPILASALTINCDGNNLFEHIIVYWIGSLLGSLLARYTNLWIHNRIKSWKNE